MNIIPINDSSSTYTFSHGIVNLQRSKGLAGKVLRSGFYWWHISISVFLCYGWLLYGFLFYWLVISSDMQMCELVDLVLIEYLLVWLAPTGC